MLQLIGNYLKWHQTFGRTKRAMKRHAYYSLETALWDMGAFNLRGGKR